MSLKRYEYFEVIIKSLNVANRVIDAIIESTCFLESDFEIFQPDSFKLENDGN
ncbi:hypothetical protein GCM10009117_21870 [Gangjinia marincola]|uniref:Uncharacterized protein n=1 Tax=Gangjinia marincola TaxID=578463 RepID=A0ABP3XUV3_9FLAO